MDGRTLAFEILKMALKEKVIRKKNGIWEPHHFKRLESLMDDIISSEKLSPSGKAPIKESSGGPLTERALRTILTPSLKERGKGSFPRESSLNFLLRILDIPTINFLKFEECVVCLKLDPQTELNDPCPLSQKIGDYLKVEAIKINPASEDRDSSVGDDRASDPIFGKSEEEGDSNPRFYKVIDNAIISTSKGEVQVEIEIFGNEGFRSATIIYRGRDINFQRPHPEGRWEADDQADEPLFQCYVPKAMPENSETGFATVTCRLIEMVKKPGSARLGKVFYRFRIWDVSSHPESDYLSLFLTNDTPLVRSPKFNIKASQLQ